MSYDFISCIYLQTSKHITHTAIYREYIIYISTISELSPLLPTRHPEVWHTVLLPLFVLPLYPSATRKGPPRKRCRCHGWRGIAINQNGCVVQWRRWWTSRWMRYSWEIRIKTMWLVYQPRFVGEDTYLTHIWFDHLFDHFGLWFEAWICIKLTRVSFAVSGE